MRGRSRFVGAGGRRHSTGVVAGDAPFSPLDLSPYGWWRADDVVLSGSDATTINDKSGNGRDFVAVNPAAQIASSHGGQPSLDFVSASSEHYSAGNVGNVGAGDLTVINAVFFDATGAYVMAKRLAGDGWGCFITGAPVYQTIADGATALVADSETIVTGAFRIVRNRIRGGVSATAFVSGSGTATAGNAGTITNTENLVLGARSDGGANFFDGQWSESILLLRDITADEITALTTYFNDRYSLALSSI